MPSVMILKYFYDLLNKNQTTLAFQLNYLPDAHSKPYNNSSDRTSGIFPDRPGNTDIRDYR